MATTRAKTRLSSTTTPNETRGSRALPVVLILFGLAAIATSVREERASRAERAGRTALEDAVATGEAGRLAVAVAVLERAADAHPSRPLAHVLLAEAYSGSPPPKSPPPSPTPSARPGDPGSGFADDPAEAAPFPGDPALVIAVADRALALDPFSARAHLLRAVALSRLGRVDDADAAFERAVRAAPSHPDIAARVAEHFLFEAVETNDPRAIQRARAAVTRLGRLEPASLERSLALLAPFEEKITDLAPLVPDTWEARYHWARFLTSSGYWDEGLAAFRDAASERGEGSTFLVHATVDFALHLVKHGRFEDSLAALEEACALNGGAHPEPLLVGRTLMHLGRREEAEAIYLKDLRRGSGRDRKLETAYAHFVEAGLLAESVPFLERVSREVPFFYAPLRLLGRAHVALGREREAERVLEEYVQHDRNPAAFEELYRLAVKTGQWRSATEYIRKALLYAPENAEYATLLRQAEERAKEAG